MGREPALPPPSRVALSLLGIALVLAVHLSAWFVLMLGRPTGGAHRTTAWTVLFFVPDAVLAAGLLAAGVWRERRVVAATWLGTLGSLALILYLFVASPARRWSLPVVPPFGG